MLESMWHDLRYALRALRRTPVFTLATVSTLAMAFGAHLAVFSFVDAVLLRPLTYHDPDRLVVIHETTPQLGRFPVSAIEFEEWQRTAKTLQSSSLVAFTPVTLTGVDVPERLDGARVSPAFFSLLGTSPALGRLFAAGDEVIGRHRVAVLDNGLWRRRFGADPSVLGRVLTLNGISFTVVGVLPQDFRFPTIDHLLSRPVAAGRPEIWLPFAITADDRNENSFAAIARLTPTATVAKAQTELTAIHQVIGRRFTPALDLRADVVPLQAQVTAPARQSLLFLWAGVAIVLVIATANIANLLVARASRRRRELALHAALGAERHRLIQLTALEGIALASFGAVGGVVLAQLMLPTLVAMAPAEVPRLDEVGLSLRTTLFGGGLAIVCGLLLGVIPGWRAARGGVTGALRQQAFQITAPRQDRVVLRLLVALQVAATVVTVTSAALLVRSLSNVLRVDRGFEVQEVSSVEVAAAGPRYASRELRATLVRTALERLRAIPGVASVAVVNKLPLTGIGMNSILVAAGTEDAPIALQERPLADVRSIDADYFHTLGVPIVRGRNFEAVDDRNPVAIVSAAAAARAWPGRDPIGQRFRLTADPQQIFDVVGVAGDMRAFGLDGPVAMSVYLPYARGFLGRISFAFRTTGSPAAIEPAIIRALHGIDPDLAVSHVRTMSEAVADDVAPRRLDALVLASFAGLALLLAGIGVYGVLAFAVLQRTREIGVRMALGSTPARIRRLILRDAGLMVALGIVAGIPLTVWSGLGLRALLFGVTPGDPATLAGAALTLTLIAALAAYAPARRAARIDPVISLRTE